MILEKYAMGTNHNLYLNIQSRTINLFSYEEESAEKIRMEGGDSKVKIYDSEQM